MTWFIDNIAMPRAEGPDPIFALLRDDKTPIGVAECQGRSTEEAAADGGLDLGFWIGEPYWGQGYICEAIAGLIERAFARPESAVIRSGAYKGNDRSLRVHEKLGFERTGMKTSKCRSRGTEVPLITLRLTRERFERG